MTEDKLNGAMTREELRLRIGTLLPNLDFAVTRAPDGCFGEFSTNAPLQFAKKTRQAPVLIGETLRQQLAPHFEGHVEYLNGRLNFFMSDTSFRQALALAARDGAHYGAGDALAGKRVLVEYVSSDPTGPLPFSAGRYALVGEALCRLIENAGARVTREFYLNDATSSSKVRWLGEGVARWYGRAFGKNLPTGDGPDDAFVRGVASDLARRDGAKWLSVADEERLEACSRAALEAAIESQQKTLERFGVRFNAWVSEVGLRRDGRVEAAFERLTSRGHTYERDGALWLATSRFGDETDRVLRRANGNTTYFADDIAYHLWKAEREFDLVLNLWSAEHRPYVERTKAALLAAGIDESRFEFLICESAVLKRDGVTLRLGTGGGAPLLDEELEELGADALKFFFAREKMERVAEVDLEVARRDDESNPAYLVQLLPSRLARLIREAEGALASGVFNPDIVSRSPEGDEEWAPGERELARLVALWPDEAQDATLRRSPEKIAAFVVEIGKATRTLLAQTKPSLVPIPTRLELLRAAQSVTASALRILDIEARERF